MRILLNVHFLFTVNAVTDSLFDIHASKVKRAHAVIQPALVLRGLSQFCQIPASSFLYLGASNATLFRFPAFCPGTGLACSCCS